MSDNLILAVGVLFIMFVGCVLVTILSAVHGEPRLAFGGFIGCVLCAWPIWSEWRAGRFPLR